MNRLPLTACHRRMSSRPLCRALYRNDCGSVEYGRWGSTPAWSGGRSRGRNHGNPRAVKAVHGRPAVTYAEPAVARPCHLPCRVGGRRSAGLSMEPSMRASERIAARLGRLAE